MEAGHIQIASAGGDRKEVGQDAWSMVDERSMFEITPVACLLLACEVGFFAQRAWRNWSLRKRNCRRLEFFIQSELRAVPRA